MTEDGQRGSWSGNLVGQRADDDAQVGEGAVDGRHLLETVSLRLTLQHALAAGQVDQTQGGCVEKKPPPPPREHSQTDQRGWKPGRFGGCCSHLLLMSLPPFTPSMSSWKTEWEREERSFWAVWAVERFWLAKAIRPRTCRQTDGGCLDALAAARAAAV